MKTFDDLELEKSLREYSEAKKWAYHPHIDDGEGNCVRCERLYEAKFNLKRALERALSDLNNEHFQH